MALLLLPAELAPYEQTIALSDERTLTLSLEKQGQAAALRVCYHDPLFAPETELEEEAVVAPLRLAATLAPAPSWRERLKAFWPRPVWAFAIAVLLALLALPHFWPVTNTTVTAAELLQKSLAAENQIHNDQAFVVRRRYQLEVRDAATQRLLTQRQFERWSNAAQAVTHKQSADALTPSERWLLEQSLTNFATLAAQAARAQVEEQAEHFVLHYEFANTHSVPGVLQTAALTVDKASLRAVAQSWRVSAPPQTLQYDLRETAFERIATAAAPAAAFTPDTDLPIVITRNAAPNATNQTSAAPAAPVTAVDFAALEIEARTLLEQANANLGEQITFTRTPAGKLVIHLLVETETRKAALIQALAPLREHPTITLQLATYAEAARAPARESTIVTQIEAAAASFPLKRSCAGTSPRQA